MIVIKNLKKTFGENEILKGVNLSIEKGETLAVIGPSGSGKSTLLRTLNYLEVPTSGEIYIDGELLDEKSQKQIRKKVGMVFQHFNLFNNMTVLENIIYGPTKVLGMDRSLAIARAEGLLERVNLTHKADAYPSSLSGGQKQRIAILRALIMEPEVLLLDEPTSALDPEMVKEVLDFIKSLAHIGMTIIMNTHEMGFAQKVAEKIVFLDHGVVVEENVPSEFFNNPRSERVKEFLSKMC